MHQVTSAAELIGAFAAAWISGWFMGWPAGFRHAVKNGANRRSTW